MNQATITSLTGAFDPAALLATFLLFAPFIIGVIGVLVGVSLVKWGFKKVKGKLSGGI